MNSQFTVPNPFRTSLFRDLFDFFFLPFCAICRERLKEKERILCEECWSSIPLLNPPFCQRCGSPMTKRFCQRCEEIEFQFLRGRSLGIYEGVLSEIVKLIKFKRKTTLAKRIGGMMSVLLRSDPILKNGDLLIPVPLHRTRKRERGYNQSLLLAEAISHSTEILLLDDLLLRTRATRPQTDLSSEDRRENVKGAFRVKGGERIRGKRVVLVDDVFTTGSTLEAGTEALLEGGAEGVFCLTAAVTT